MFPPDMSGLVEKMRSVVRKARSEPLLRNWERKAIEECRLLQNSEYLNIVERILYRAEHALVDIEIEDVGRDTEVCLKYSGFKVQPKWDNECRSRVESGSLISLCKSTEISWEM